MDYTALFERHVECDADVSICVLPVDTSEASELGILKMEKRGRITEFCEKPDRPELIESLKVDVDAWQKAGVTAERPLMASMGIYLFKTEALVEVLRGEPMMDFGRDIIPYSLSRYGVCGYVFNGYWEDIGTIGAFYRAHRDLVTAVPKFNLFDANFPIYTHPRFLPGIKVNSGEIERSILNDGGIIERSVIKRSVIGVRSRVGARTSIEDSLVMGADYFDETQVCGKKMPPVGIGRNCRIRRAIIDKNVRIGNKVILENRKKLRSYDDPRERFYIRNGIIVVVKGAVIEDGLEV